MTREVTPGMTDGDIDALLAAAREDIAPIGADLRARILADAPDRSRATRPDERSAGRLDGPLGRWLGGLVAIPGAALLGLWIGLAQPAAVLDLLPQATALDVLSAGDVESEDTGAEAALLGEVFGTAWADGTLEGTQ